MKKYLVFGLAVSVLYFAVLGMIFNFGCGQTSDTTTTTISSTQVNAAKTGVLVASGGSAIGASAASAGSAASTNPNVMSVKALAGPPDTFFTTDLTTSSDGYISATSETVGGSMTPKMRMKTQGGDVIGGTYLSGKKIAKWITLEVQSIFSSGPNQIPPGMTAEVENFISRYTTSYLSSGNPFADTSLFYSISTEADFLCWVNVYTGSMEAGINSHTMPPGVPYIYLTTPEATNNDKIGSMDMKMTFSKTATGEFVLSIPTASNGMPTAGTYSSGGTLQTPIGSMESTLLMNFSADGPPTWLKMVGTTETTPKYTVIVYMCPTTMTATGEVFDSSGTRIGTIEGTPSGGKVYIGGASEAFSF